MRAIHQSLFEIWRFGQDGLNEAIENLLSWKIKAVIALLLWFGKKENIIIWNIALWITGKTRKGVELFKVEVKELRDSNILSNYTLIMWMEVRDAAY